jgi:hypothetical protein
MYLTRLPRWLKHSVLQYDIRPSPDLKQSHNTPMEGEKVYSSYSLTTSAVDGGEWSASRPGRALPPGKGPTVPIGQEAGWAPELVWTQRLQEESFCLCRGSYLDRPIVQSVVRHYSDWATPAPSCNLLAKILRVDTQLSIWNTRFYFPVS